MPPDLGHMKMGMNLNEFLSGAFPEGISYDDAATLCLRIYCSVDGLPEYLHSECDKESISEAFAFLYRENRIIGSTSSSVLYGANLHSCSDKDHWIEVIASIFKKKVGYDLDRAQELIDRVNGK